MVTNDILDTKRDTLYCSYKCAIQGGADEADLLEVTEEQYDIHRQEEAAGEGWGAICPTCEGEYNGF